MKIVKKIRQPGILSAFIWLFEVLFGVVVFIAVTSFIWIPCGVVFVFIHYVIKYW